MNDLEIETIIAVATFVCGGVAWYVKTVIIEPLQKHIDRNASDIEKFKTDLEKIKHDNIAPLHATIDKLVALREQREQLLNQRLLYIGEKIDTYATAQKETADTIKKLCEKVVSVQMTCSKVEEKVISVDTKADSIDDKLDMTSEEVKVIKAKCGCLGGTNCATK